MLLGTSCLSNVVIDMPDSLSSSEPDSPVSVLWSEPIGVSAVTKAGSLGTKTGAFADIVWPGALAERPDNMGTKTGALAESGPLSAGFGVTIVATTATPDASQRRPLKWRAQRSAATRDASDTITSPRPVCPSSFTVYSKSSCSRFACWKITSIMSSDNIALGKPRTRTWQASSNKEDGFTLNSPVASAEG